MSRWPLLALGLLLAVSSFAQESTPAPEPTEPAPATPAPATPATAAPTPATPTPVTPAVPAPNAPEEYEEGEFGHAARTLRRGEIILFGSLPLTLFLSYEVYDIYRFFDHDRDPQYAPWPARRADAVPYEKTETAGVLLAAASVSLVIAVTDYLIGRAIERRAAKRRSPDR